MGQAGEDVGGGRTFLEDLSLDLTHVAIMLAQYAEKDALRREALAGRTVTARQVEALIAARHARSAAFGFDLANPGWSLLLELYRAHLAAAHPGPVEGAHLSTQGGVRINRLALAARLASTTVLRWLDRLCAAGLAERRRDPASDKGILAALTPAGVEAMADYFAAARAGWIIG